MRWRELERKTGADGGDQLGDGHAQGRQCRTARALATIGALKLRTPVTLARLSETPDPYAILQLGADASPGDVRAAFRRLALEHHPDRSPGSEARMVAINWAYAVLGDPDRRAEYDRTHAHGAAPAVEPAAEQPTGDGEVELWGLDLDRHADDWRQMYEEERLVWERLLDPLPAGAPDRVRFERELQRAKAAQLSLENALRAREGLPAIGEDEFERARSAERERARSVAPAGCLGVLLLAFVPPLRARF